MEAFTFSMAELILLSVAGVFLIIQYIYYLGIYNRIHMRNITDRKNELHFTKELPPLSVVICARNESENLRRFLPAILEQDYPQFEVIVIKASKHDWLVFTEANCQPASNQWLRLMARNFTPHTQIVLGYSGYERGKGWLHKRISFNTLFTSLRYLGFALAGKPYMGLGRNLAYRKELFFKQKGYSTHLNLQRGEDDLFINQIANTENTRVETNARAIMRMQPIERYKDWKEERVSYMATARYYKGVQRYLLGFETCSRLLFYMACIAGIVFGIIHSHWLVAGIAFFIWLLRYTVQAIVINKTATDQEENRHYYFSLLLFDLLQPLQTLQFKLYRLYRGKGDFMRR